MKEGMSGKVGVSGFLLCMSMVFAPFTGCANGSNNKKKWGIASWIQDHTRKGKRKKIVCRVFHKFRIRDYF